MGANSHVVFCLREQGADREVFARSQQARRENAARRQSLRRVRAREEEAGEEGEEPWVEPTLDPTTPSPIFGGSTGGLLRKAQVEEFYVITWDSKKEQIFEMPTGGAAIMRQGPNLL